LPVIGVPVKASALEGLDALLSIVQMPAGVPVATVAINNGKNAGILAAQIVGVKFPEIRARVKAYKTQLERAVMEKAERLERSGG
jgi:5-(carboxyamino)imidazole ribonucleotide mutase